MNKNVKILIIIVAIIICSVAGVFIYKNIEENNLSKLPVYNYEEDSNYVKYTDIEGIEFSYPSNYQPLESAAQPTYMDPDILGASVNINYEDSKNLSLEKYLSLSEDSIKSVMSLEGEINEEYMNLNGVKAVKIDYIAKQNGVNVKITQAILIKSGKAYILTIGCLPGDEEAMKEKTDKMIKSFK